MAVRARRRGTPRGWPRRIFWWIVKGGALFIIVSLLWVLLYRFVPPPITLTQVGDLLGGRSISRDWMSLDEMDRDMVRAAVAAEDSKFCTHSGFDQDAIAAAMRRNARGDKIIRGGSTISQQTAKNAFLWQGGGYFRKGLEAWFTVLIENIWGKRRIMEVYLNVAETGIGTYGANAGAQRYFRHDASNLSRTEAARIAAILPLPKKRGAVAPKGFTRRYGNSIAARVGIVARDGLDACVYRSSTPSDPAEAPVSKRKAAPKKVEKAATKQEAQELPGPDGGLPGEDYEDAVTTTEAPQTESEATDDSASGQQPAGID